MKELDIYGNENEVLEVDIYGDEITPEKECGRIGCDYYLEGKCNDKTYPFCEKAPALLKKEINERNRIRDIVDNGTDEVGTTNAHDMNKI